MTIQEFKAKYPGYSDLSDEDVTNFLKNNGAINDDGTLNDGIISSTNWDGMDFIGQREALRNAAIKKGVSAENQKRMETRNRVEKNAANAYYGLGAANTIAGLSQAMTQKARGRQQLAELQKTMPQAPEFQRNQRLAQELNVAQRRAETGIDPATRALMLDQAQQAQQAVNRGAMVAGGGQAGLTGAMMQAAGPNRWRMALGLAQAQQQALQGNRADYRNLMSQQQAEDSLLRQARQAQYEKGYAQHMANMKSAQQLQAAGGINQANIMSTIPVQAYNTIANMPWLQRYGQTGNTGQMNTVNPLQSNPYSNAYYQNAMGIGQRAAQNYTPTPLPPYMPSTNDNMFGVNYQMKY